MTKAECFAECRAEMRAEKRANREAEVIDEMRGRGWVRPLDVGGHSRSHHSATLARLCRVGIVERRLRGIGAGYSRPSYLYRLKP